MTFEEAKNILKEYRSDKIKSFDVDKFDEAVDTAIKILEQEYSEDCISREAVMNVLGDSINDDKDHRRAVVLLNNLPSVTSKEKIVYCKDCKYRDYWGECNKWSKELDAHKTYILDKNMFCGFAENKDGENKE